MVANASKAAVAVAAWRLSFHAYVWIAALISILASCLSLVLTWRRHLTRCFDWEPLYVGVWIASVA